MVEDSISSSSLSELSNWHTASFPCTFMCFLEKREFLRTSLILDQNSHYLRDEGWV